MPETLLDPRRPLGFSSLADGKEGPDETTHVGGLVASTHCAHVFFGTCDVMRCPFCESTEQKHLLFFTFLFFPYSSVPGLRCGMCGLVPWSGIKPRFSALQGWSLSQQGMPWKGKWKSLSRVQLSATPWNSPGQNTGVGSLSLLQGIFPTQESNPGLALQADSLPAEPPGKPKKRLEWVAFPFSRGSSQPRNRTQVLRCRQILYQLSHQGSPRRDWSG